MDYWKNKSLEDLSETNNGVLYREKWKPVIGYEEYYAVSDFGRIKSYSRMVAQPTRCKVNKRRERILTQVISRTGYCKVALFVNKKRVDTAAHILVAKSFIENPFLKPQVNHKFGNKKDNRVSQIEWSTAKENSNHAILIGIDSVIGTHNGRCLLTEEMVREIRNEYFKGELTQKELSIKYNVGQTQISRIILNKAWKHLK